MASDGLRVVTVNGVRFFRADDVERWHRGRTKAEEHAAEVAELAESVLEVFRRERSCPLCGTVTPPCRCIALARRLS